MSKGARITNGAVALLHEMSAQRGFVLLVSVALIVLIVWSLLITSLIATTVAAAITCIELWLVVALVVLVERCIVSIEAHLGCSSELGEVLILHLVGVHSVQVCKLSHNKLVWVHASHWHLILLAVVVLLMVLYKDSKDLLLNCGSEYLHPFKLFLILIIIT
jgi:hypothetical protein